MTFVRVRKLVEVPVTWSVTSRSSSFVPMRDAILKADDAVSTMSRTVSVTGGAVTVVVTVERLLHADSLLKP